MSSVTHPQPMSSISTGRLALFVTLGTESVFFATLLVAYAALRGQVNWDIPHTLSRLTIPLVNTGILLISAMMVWWSSRAIRRGQASSLRSGLLVSVLLGLCFVAGQIIEFNQAGLRIDDQAFGGVFFTLIGFHALHMLAGVFFLGLNLVRANLGDFSVDRHEAVELGSGFWYYVTAVWVVLFLALYIL
ncbi:MAG TPA: cytochrome c oxidase subunit 3 [Bellilinea sp.]|nr:cytochrome c oxidase subunit 3 [Bellilinea sp.]